MGCRWRIGATAAVAGMLLALTACSDASERALPPASPLASPTAKATPALSGASGAGVADGAFGAWRGQPVDIAGTWADNDEASIELWQLQPGGEYASWRGPLDIAVGAIDAGETWKNAAAGEYDSRWAQSLRNLRSYRSSATGTTYIRFAHEMNGNWYPWRVNSGNFADFDVAWKRYRALQKKIFPSAKLVFSPTRESVGTGMDWRGFFPGADSVDLIGVDYYNQYPTVASEAEWRASLDDVDQFGGPKGLDRYRSFAKSVRLPMAITEWSGNATSGDYPVFVTSMLEYVQRHAGAEPGQIPYEILFDVDQDDNNFTLSADGTRMPQSAAAYRAFFR